MENNATNRMEIMKYISVIYSGGQLGTIIFLKNNQSSPKPRFFEKACRGSFFKDY